MNYKIIAVMFTLVLSQAIFGNAWSMQRDLEDRSEEKSRASVSVTNQLIERDANGREILALASLTLQPAKQSLARWTFPNQYPDSYQKWQKIEHLFLHFQPRMDLYALNKSGRVSLLDGSNNENVFLVNLCIQTPDLFTFYYRKPSPIAFRHQPQDPLCGLHYSPKAQEYDPITASGIRIEFASYLYTSEDVSNLLKKFDGCLSEDYTTSLRTLSLLTDKQRIWLRYLTYYSNLFFAENMNRKDLLLLRKRSDIAFERFEKARANEFMYCAQELPTELWGLILDLFPRSNGEKDKQAEKKE